MTTTYSSNLYLLFSGALLTGIVFATSTVGNAVAEGRPTPEQVRRLWEESMTSSDRSVRTASGSRLRQLPVEVVTPTIENMLKSDERFQEQPWWRNRAYSIVLYCKGTRGDADVRLALAGLSDPDEQIQSCSLGILSQLPPGDYPEVRTAVAEMWESERIEDLPTASTRADDEYSRLHSGILVAGLACGVVDESTGVELLRGIARNRSLEQNIRLRAVSEMLEREGFKKGLNLVAGLDAGVVKSVVNDLSHDAVQSDWTFGGDVDKQSAARGFVLEQMTHENVEVRRAALNALVQVYGKDWVTIRSQTDFEINPVVRSAIARMADRDPDATLREAAAEWLDYAEPRVERAVKTFLDERGRTVDPNRTARDKENESP